jgi:signal transduction histidine kinase
VFDLHEVSQESLGEKFNRLEDGLTINYESRMKTAKRGTIPVAVYVRKVNLSSENAIQWILRNISERKALDVMREDLAAMIYHDLRSPLANIVSSLDMLEAIIPPGTSPSVETLFNISSRSIDRMQRLINSLLDINRLETGKPITNQKAIDPHVLVKEAVDAVMPIVESKHQVVKILLPADLPELWVDTDMIRRVIINLVENATKFTPMNETVTIGGQSEGNWVRMWIIDHGQGISPEFHEQIFEKFTRLQSDRYPKGMGLGLAFCRLAVQAHGGKIWVESEVNKGSTFIFTLPVVKSLS